MVPGAAAPAAAAAVVGALDPSASKQVNAAADRCCLVAGQHSRACCCRCCCQSVAAGLPITQSTRSPAGHRMPPSLPAAGAQDAANFRRHIQLGLLPAPSDVTFEGVIKDYFFSTHSR